MSTRTQVLELAILGRLRSAPTHGYELRKHLNASLGTVRTLSYGSLYPALRSLTERGLIAADTPELRGGAALAGRRTKIVYRITDVGLAHLEDSLSSAEPASWEDEAFAVRFALFASTDATTRLRILEGRRARMVERRESMRTSFGATGRRMDAYTTELARHGLEQVDREVEWLERVIDTERGTRGALDYRAITSGSRPAAESQELPADAGPTTAPPAAPGTEPGGGPRLTPLPEQAPHDRRDPAADRTNRADATGAHAPRDARGMNKEKA